MWGTTEAVGKWIIIRADWRAAPGARRDAPGGVSRSEPRERTGVRPLRHLRSILASPAPAHPAAPLLRVDGRVAQALRGLLPASPVGFEAERWCTDADWRVIYYLIPVSGPRTGLKARSGPESILGRFPSLPGSV